MSVINIGNSVLDFTKSDSKVYSNVELTVDDSTAVRARYYGDLLSWPVSAWKTHGNSSGSVDVGSNDFYFSCNAAVTNWGVSIFSNPSVAKYRQLVGKTVHVAFRVTGLSTGYAPSNWKVYAGLHLQQNKTADLNRLYFKDFPYISANGTYTYDVVIGSNDFKSDYADGWFGMYFFLYSDAACDVHVYNISAYIDDDSQDTLTADCPWATIEIAEQVMSKLSGFEYNPYDATGARLTPAAELGDTVIIDGDGYDLVSQEAMFGSEYVSNISAPYDEELDHEFTYVPSTERRYTRELRTLKAELAIQADAIEAKVSSVGGNQSSFGWKLQNTNFTVYASGGEVLKVTSEGATIQGRVVATSGTIGGCEIVNGKLQISSANIGNINAEQITAGYINVDRIKTGSITSKELANASVIEAKINNGAVTIDKIGSYAVSPVKTSFGGTLNQVGVNQSDISAIKNYFLNILTVNTLQINGNLYVKAANGVTHAFRPIQYSAGTARYILGATS